MNAERDRRRHDVFAEAMDLPASEREAFVRAQCPEDEELQRELLMLLSTLDEETSFLKTLDTEEFLKRFDDAAIEEVPELEGRTIADRYDVGRRLGVGGAGVVYKAHDRLTKQDVALKALFHAGERGRSDLRREAGTLRLLRIPGIVQLLDDGLHDGVAWMSMEFIDGMPFPGRAGVMTWNELEPVAIALLEAVERMHRAGIVHGDLKPGNVLVRPSGVPAILDLGIARGRRVAGPRRQSPGRAGTMRYAAPEQVREGVIRARSDLYAIGVMLHEALTGEAMRGGPTVALARVGVYPREAQRREVATEGLTEPIAKLLRALLAEDANERPESAGSVLRTIHAASTASREGRLHPILRHAFQGLAQGIPPEPFSPEKLRALFHGPDRIFHLQEDGAAEVHKRTQGDPLRVVQELDAWSRAGLGWWSGPRYTLRREDIDHLSRAPRAFSTSPAALEADLGLDDADLDLLIAVELAGLHATVPILAKVTDSEEREARVHLERLVEKRLLRAVDDRYAAADALPQGVQDRLLLQGQALHLRLAAAIPPGEPGRLLHLVAGGESEAVPAEALLVGGALLEAGDIAGAREAVRQGLDALEGASPSGLHEDLGEVLLMVAISSATPTALDEVLYRVACLGEGGRLALVERVARGLIHAIGGEPRRALDDMPRAHDVDTDALRQSVLTARLFAVRSLKDPESFEREIEEAKRLAEALDSDRLRASARVAEGWLHYQHEEYARAASCHSEAAARTPSGTGRIMVLLNAASASLECGDLDRAHELARTALEAARIWRHPPLEARAEYMLRAAAYRRRDPVAPDPRFGLALLWLSHLGGRALALMGEAAITWRAGRPHMAARLADAAADAWQGAPHRKARLLVQALAVACRGAEAQEARRLLAECRACPDASLGVQAAGLLAKGCPGLQAECRSLVAERMPEVPPSRRDLRLEVLAPSEAVK